MSLDDYFLGYDDDRIRRARVFTDRQEERDVLTSRIQQVVARQADSRLLTNYRRPAANLTAVYGEGGIGKTALLQEIAGGFETHSHDVVKCSTYIDFSDFTNHNFEVVLVRVRSALARAGRRWPAFDLAFASYWVRQHPGMPLINFLDQASFLSSGDRRALIEQFTSILDNVLGGVGLISAGYRLAGILKQRIQESRTVKSLRAAYHPFGLLLDETHVEKVLGYLPSVLAYDLAQIQIKKNVSALCVLDTLEYIQLSRHGKESLEDLISRLVYLMPNVAFLAASRLPLKWYDAAHESMLTYGGSDRWPDLVPSALGQYQMRGLDSQASDELLRESLTFDGTPAMPEAVRERIIRGSQGLPLYLELSVNWYRDLMVKGKAPGTGEIAQAFPELVFRIMRDLSSGERDLLRVAAILEAFSPELLESVLPGTRGMELRRFIDRTFVRRAAASWLQYSLHQTLRRAIVDYDNLTEDAWTAEEWHEHAEQAVHWLESQALSVWEEGLAGQATGEEAARRAVAALLLVGTAAVEHGIVPKGLGRLAFTTAQFGYRRVFESLPEIEVSDPALHRLLAVAKIVARTDMGSVDVYNAVHPLVTYDESNPYDQFIATEFSRIAEDIGQYSEAVRAYDSLTSATPEMAYYGRIGLAAVAIRRAELDTALSTAPRDSNLPIYRAAANDLIGHIYLQGGEHKKASSFFERALENAKEAGSAAWVARGTRHIAMARQWYDPDGTLDIVSEAIEINEALGDRIGVAQCEMSTGLAWAWKGDWERARSYLSAAKSHDLDPQAIGQPMMAEILLSRAEGDDQSVNAAVEHLFAITWTDSERPTVWLAVGALWAGRPDLADFGQIRWYDSVTAARRRWQIPLQRMRRVYRAHRQRDG